ncbi:MAG: ThiF family adenylyltransferase, partial [Verrucomicrobiota bacterium]
MSYLSRIAATYKDTILSEEELIYYAKHILLPGVGAIGQKKLKASRVLVVGAGGLGCPVLQALVGAGVGRVTIVDGDAVTLGNLPRQWLFDANNIGVNKA